MILIDQNISFRVISRINATFPDVEHVKSLNLMDTNDYDIFMFARRNTIEAVITLDEDFNLLVMEHNPPPKIIWLRIGNASTAVQAETLLRNAAVIRHFLTDSQTDCLEIYK
jgi:predicted nuclease of predicted toxin-antitoxin system